MNIVERLWCVKIVKIRHFVISFKTLLSFSVGSSSPSRFCSFLNTGRSDLRFSAQNILQEYLQQVHAKMRRNLFVASVPLGKNLNIIEQYEGHVTLLPSSIDQGGQYDTKYSPFDWILRASFAGERIWLFLREPA